MTPMASKLQEQRGPFPQGFCWLSAGHATSPTQSLARVMGQACLTHVRSRKSGQLHPDHVVREWGFPLDVRQIKGVKPTTGVHLCVILREKIWK